MNYELWLLLLGLLAMIVSFQLPAALIGRNTATVRIVGVIMFGLAYVVPNSYTIDEGHEGVLETFGAAEDVPMEPGFHFKMPWQQVHELNMRAQDYHHTFECSSKDLQVVTIEMVTIWQRKPGSSVQIWRGVGDRSLEVDVQPGTGEVLKSVVASYNATDLVRDLEGASGTVKSKLQEWMDRFEIQIPNCNIARNDFSDTFEQAVELKKKAFEEANTAVNQVQEERKLAEQQIAEATGDANGKIELARGNAEQVTRSADAKAYETIRQAEATATQILDVGRSEAIRLYKLGEQLTPEVVQLEAYEKWKAAGGNVPQVHLSGSSVPGMLIQAPVPAAGSTTSSNR